MSDYSSLAGVDLSDPDHYAQDDGLSLLARVREAAPVFWNTSTTVTSFWALTRHADAVRVLQDREAFSSERGMTVGQNDAAALSAAGKMLIVTDNPRHKALRLIMNRAFQAAAVGQLEAGMRRALRQVLTEIDDGVEFDFVSRVAGVLPLMAICRIMDIPQADWPEMFELTRLAFGSTDGEEVITAAERIEANCTLLDYFEDLTQRRRNSDGDDLISHLGRVEIEGERLTDDEIVFNILGLVTGGNETTRHATAGGVIALVDNPEQWRLLKADRSLVRSAVEEILRWTAPSLNVMRTVTRPVVVGDVLMQPGERVSIWNPAVNRDPEAFPHPDRFIVSRTPNRHLTFGLGDHHCIGAILARTELRVLLGELLDGVGALEITGPVKRIRSNLMWGVDRLPVKISRAQV